MTASMAGPVFAHPDDVGAGHLPAVQENVTLLGHANIEGGGAGQVADVSAFGNYAYLTVRDPEGCSDAGVAVFDISDPTNPRQVEFIEATEGSFPGEGSQVVDLKTSSFTGQVLVFNNEICAAGGEGGVTLWDVTNPLQPTLLKAHAGDNDPGGFVSEFNQIHSAFAWQDKGRAFVVIVDNEEGGEGDIDILEITDPANPVVVSELGLNELGVEQDSINGSEQSFLHDMVVQKVQGRMVMLLSYWDGGWVQLDVTDPANPRLISESDFPNPDPLTGITPTEGNAHQAEFSPNGKLILGTSEDFAPYRLVPTITSGPFSGTTFVAQPAGGIPQVEPNDPLSGPVRYVGAACLPSTVPQAQPGEVALIERGGCTFQAKTDAINAAGYAGGIVFNSTVAGNGCETLINMLVTESDVPMLFVSRSTGYQLLGIPGYDPAQCEAGTNPSLPAVGTAASAVDIQSVFDGWGYVHLLDARTMQQLDAYAIDEALDPAYAQGFGDLSVHEVAVDPWRKDIAYLSYYSGGLRVIRYDEKTGITEVGAYISPEGNNFWGVEAHRLPQGTKGAGKQTLILASDRDSGLWIFTYDETGKVKGKTQGKTAGKASGAGNGKRMDEVPAKAKGFHKRSARVAG